MTVYHYLLILLLACLFLSFPSFSQKRMEKQIKRLETEAGQLYESKLWGEARDAYLLLDSLSPGNPEYQFRLGVIYYHSINKAKSLPYFLEAVKNGKSDPNINFYLARAYHFNLDFNKAIDYYEKALKVDDAASAMTQEQKQEIKKHIEDCKLAAQFIQDPLLTPIENIGEPINSPYPEYVPLLTANEDMMIFTSRRPNTTGKSVDQQGIFMEDVYISHRMGNGEWTEPDNDLKFNTKEHDACVGLSPDGKKLILYRSDNGGDLYVSDFDGAKWSEPVALDGINTVHWESSACFSADGKSLYFTSDKPGGSGGSDIYRAEIEENGKFGKIENLGSIINTPFDEDAPQIHSDGKTLFFSSKGHKGLGGYDIYSSLYHEETDSWEIPKNIGYPINTPDDDIYFSLLYNGSKGFFTSYRNDSYGEKDIYRITRPGSVPTKFLMKIKLIDPFTGNSIDAKISIKDTRNGEVKQLNREDILQGKYVVPLDFETEYLIGIDATGYRFKEKSIYIDYRADIFEYIMNIVPNREEIITLVDSADYVNALNKVRMEEYINPDDQGQIDNFSGYTESSYSEGQVKTTENILPVTELGGQKKTGDQEASSGDQRVEQGLSMADRNSSSRAAIRSRNMNVELKFSEESELRNKLLSSVRLSGDDNWIKQIMNNESHVIFLTRLDTRNKVVIPVVNFKFDDYSLNADYVKYLGQMADFLKDNSTTSVLIAGHTDWIGTSEYNLQLSVKRAKSVRDQLIKFGLPDERLSIHGFGEELPLLSNETVFGRKVNRRASMMMVDIQDPKYEEVLYMDLLQLFGIELAVQPGYSSPLIVWEKLPLSVNFPENEDGYLTDYSRKKLRDLAVYLKNTPYTLIMAGFEDKNEQRIEGDLGQQRSWLAYKYLRSLGIPDERMILIDRKDLESFFDVSNLSEAIQQRMVQFFLVKH
jgi:outer membrane protein OmpA-like peptidoglycan-associated protein